MRAFLLNTVFLGRGVQGRMGAFLLKTCFFKDLSRVKASFKSVPPQPYFEFPATFWCWLAQRFQNKVGEERS